MFLISASVLFFLFILWMVRKQHLEQKYTLTWLAVAISFVLVAVFNGIVYKLAHILSIQEPVNALFLIIFLFVLVILFTLTVTISKITVNQRKLTQEIALVRKMMGDDSNAK